ESRRHRCYRQSECLVERECYSETPRPASMLRRHKDQLFLWLPSHFRSNDTIVNRCQRHTRCDCSKELENRRRLCPNRCARLRRWTPESRQRPCYRQSEYLVESACYSETRRWVAVRERSMAARSDHRSSKDL